MQPNRTRVVPSALMLLVVILTIFSSFPTPPAHAAGVIYVQPGGKGSGSGTSWGNAKDLAAALSTAVSGDVLWVATGTYTPTTGLDRTATFRLVSGVAIYGGFSGTETLLSQRDWVANVVTLSGDLLGDDQPNFVNNGDNSYHVVTGANNAILDGVTITGGNADLISTDDNGAGMLNNVSSPTLTNVILSGNSVANFGGGIYNNAGNPTLINVTISGNTAYRGGGIYNDGGSPTLTNVILSGNLSGNHGGGMFNSGGNPTLTNVTISGNQMADGFGGGLYNEASSTPQIRNSIIWGNNSSAITNELGATPTISTSIVEGSGGSGDGWPLILLGFDGGGNLDANPSFVALGNAAPSTDGDLRLLIGSPAINAGNDAVVTVITDRDGNPRIRSTRVDMGAYEYGLVRYVWGGATGVNDGSSWTDAYTSLKVALAAAANGDELWVATGTYTLTPTNNPAESFQLLPGVAIYGGFAATETQLSQRNWVANVVTLSGDLMGDDQPNFVNNSDNSYHVVTGADDAILDGVTISGGNANGVDPDSNGAGMLNNASSPSLTNVTFSGNSATSEGGGLYNTLSSPILTNVTFSGNRAASGGAIANWSSILVLTNGTFSGNYAVNGGAIANMNSSNLVLTNGTISGNSASTNGGGLYNSGSNLQLRNSIIWGNSATNSGPGLYNTTTWIILVRHSWIEGGYGDVGTGDPLFVAPVAATSAPTTTGDYRLQAASLAINAGDNAVITTMTDRDGNPRIVGGTVDLGAYEAAPSVLSILRAGADPTNAATVSFTVTFNMPVIGVNASDFQLNVSPGQSGATLRSISGSGATWLVSVNTMDRATGTIRLDLVDNDSIVTSDTPAVPLGGGGVRNGDFTSGEVYTVDRIAPTVSMTSLAADPTADSPIPVRVTFSESVTGFTASALTVSNATVGNFSGSRTTYSFDLLPTGFGLVTAKLAAGVVTDLVGNPVPAAQFSRTFRYVRMRWYVAAGATGRGDGGSWTDAFPNLQAALAVALPDDEIWIATGTYTPGTNPSATFALKNGVVIYGGFAGGETSVSQRNWTTQPTRLSGDLLGNDGPNFTNTADNSYHVVTGVTGATLDGVTISGGNASGGGNNGYGGGLFNWAGSPTLRNSTLTGNNAVLGGAIFNYASSPTLNNVTLSVNGATFGGGMLNFSNSNPTLINVTFNNNNASSNGGGIYNQDSNPTLIDAKLCGNSAANGGGMGNWQSNPTLVNSLICGNAATTWGGGMFNYASNPLLTHVTFSGNAAAFGGGLYNSSSTPVLRNSLVWGNTAASSPAIADNSSVAAITYSVVEGGYPGVGNLSADPLFVTLMSPAPSVDGDLHLQPASLAINAGENASAPTTDHEGKPRPIGGSVDMGAYEVQFPSVRAITRADANPTSAATVTFTVSFNMPVSDLDLSDFTLTTTGGQNGATIGTISGSGTTWLVTVNTVSTPATIGTIRLDVVDDDTIVTRDLPLVWLGGSGSGNGDFNSGEFYTVDRVAPTALTLERVGTSPTNAASVQWRITFDDAVTGLSAANFTLNASGVSGASVSGVSDGPTTWLVTVATGSGDGTLTLVKSQNTGVTDLAGNALAGGDLTGASYIFDKTPPTVSLNAPALISAANQTNYLVSGNCPTDPGPLTVSVGSVQGSSACNAGSFALTLDVSALSDGNLTVSASQTDAVGNTGTANATTSKDLSAPAVVMRSLTANRTNANPILVTVSFSETVSGFTQTDISVGNATLSNFSSSSGMTYSFELTPLANGPVTADIAAGVATDAVGNPNRAAPQLSRIYDPTALSMVFSSDTPDPTNVSPIPVTVTFSQRVSDFTANELTAGNATVRNFSGSGTTYTFELVPVSQGLVTADIAAGVASDANGNLNLAPVQFTRMHDNLGPTVSLSTTAAKLTNRSPIPVSVSFSEPVGVFTTTGLTVGNATVGTFSGSGTSYSFDLTPLADGPVTVEIAAGVVTDSVGNPNLAAAALSCTYDGTAPSVMSLRALDVSSANVTNARFTVVYSDNLALDQTSLSAGNLRVRGPNGFDQAVTLVDVSAAASGPGVTVTYNLAAPGGFWDRTDNGSYTIVLVADEVRDTAGNAAVAADLGSFRVGLTTLLFTMHSYLPQINLPPAPLRGPDLVVETLTTVNGQLTMTIANLGDTAVSTPFWVDLLIAPSRAPVAPNDTWDTIGTRGLSWGITEGLTPGARLTLTLGDRFARPDFSRPGGPIVAGTTLYAHVDAVNIQSSYGGVEESHERLGLPYNNVLGPVSAASTIVTPAASTAPSGDTPVGLPVRR